MERRREKEKGIAKKKKKVKKRSERERERVCVTEKRGYRDRKSDRKSAAALDYHYRWDEILSTILIRTNERRSIEGWKERSKGRGVKGGIGVVRGEGKFY